MADEFLDYVNEHDRLVSVRKADVVAVISGEERTNQERTATVYLRGGHKFTIQSTRANVVRNVGEG